MSDIFSLPHSGQFLSQLAKGVIKRYSSDPLALSDVLILLPNRRSCIELKELFAAEAGTTTLLPRIHPLGEIGEVIHVPEMAQHISTPLSSLEQHILLTRLVWQWQMQHYQSGMGIKPSMDQAAALASTLAQFLNEVEREDINLDALKTLVPELYAQHWQLTLNFLSIISDFWPDILAEEKRISPVQHRNRAMQAIADHWQQHPPTYPVIAAGTTGSMPATRTLLSVIHALPQGNIVLSGVDRVMDDACWQSLTPSHPQYGFKRLLAVLNIERPEIKDWCVYDSDSVTTSRARLFSEVMRPAATSHAWSQLAGAKAQYQQAIADMCYIEAASLQEEAKIIALHIREVLETLDQTVMLVTNDNALAERVMVALRRWNIDMDYSAGKTLLASPVGVFLLHILEVVESQFSPVALLSLLKHPYMAAGIKTVQCREYARWLETQFLRGVRRAGGIESIIASLEKSAANDDFVKKVMQWLEGIEQALQPLLSGYTKDELSLPALLKMHMKAAEILAASDEAKGQVRLWQHEEGRQLHEMLQHLTDVSGKLGTFPPREYALLFKTLIRMETFRSSYGGHPRAKILTPIEARLQQADKVILGGLNEGCWPKNPGVDPWMNQAMRHALGLPPHDQKIGLAAYDFVQLCQAQTVVLTRAQKVDGTSALPSRWLQRLMVVLKGLSLDTQFQAQKPWEAWANMLSEPKSTIQISPPEPTPPIEARPTTLWVTQIEKLMRNPYSIYASHILKLKPLDPIDQDPGAAEFGDKVHSMLEAFIQSYEAIPVEEQLSWLLHCAEKYWQEVNDRPSLAIFWKSRFEHIAAWFVDNEAKRRKRVSGVSGECQGEWQLALSLPITLKARADRIEYYPDGSMALIDYKTGTLPNKKDVALGFSPQMTLEALIAEQGGFGNKETQVKSLEYWKLSGSRIAGIIDPLKDIEISIAAAKEGIQALLQFFSEENSPYLAEPLPSMAPKYNDYAHLARIKEWQYN